MTEEQRAARLARFGWLSALEDMKMTEKMTGIEELRTIVGAMDRCRESFMDPFTAEQIIAIWRAWRACEFDIYPDQWEERQVQEALRGIVPRFDHDEKPLYTVAA